jgi:uncharacterized membrane protein
MVTKKKRNRKRAKPLKRRISFKFATILAIVSIIGFLEITSNGFFEITFGKYTEVLWLVLLGIGFILESKPKRLKQKGRDDSVTDITALVVGCMAIIAGVLSLPFIEITHPVFFATRGVISIIAIIFIAFETWMAKN